MQGYSMVPYQFAIVTQQFSLLLDTYVELGSLTPHPYSRDTL